MRTGVLALLCVTLAVSGCGDGTDTITAAGSTTAAVTDPGADEWQPVPDAELAAQCGLDPALLDEADAVLNRPYAVVRFGRLCHEFAPAGTFPITDVYSTSKTLGALVTGIAAYQTRNLPRSGRKTGPISDGDRVDHWLDSVTFNPDALVAHVLAMVAQSDDLAFGEKWHQYDIIGAVQINRLSDIINAALQQDPGRLGTNLEEFTQRFLYAPLGMHDSTWSDGAPDKVFAYSWHTSIRDMARVGLLMLHDGVWNGERILDAGWIYRMTHPAFEDADTGYGYLTWLNADSNYTHSQYFPQPKYQGPSDACAPVALYRHYPHEFSDAPDCNYEPPYSCAESFDVGMWYAAGLGGQYIVGHRALDLVLVIKDMAEPDGPGPLWSAVRPALVALDPTFHGDEAAFCSQYGHNAYAPFGSR